MAKAKGHVKRARRVRPAMTRSLRKAVDKEIKKVTLKQVEPKHNDVFAANQTLQAGTLTLGQNLINMTSVAQGLTTSTRVGNRYKLDSLECALDLNAFSQATSASPNPIVRIMMIQDHLETGVAPVYADLFELPNSGDGAVSSLNWENFNVNSRFKLLYDKRISMQQPFGPLFTGGGATGTNFYTTKAGYFLRIKKRHKSTVAFQGTSASQADTSTGTIYLVGICDIASTCLWTAYTRVVYKDI